MEEEFVSYEQAVALKELGFDVQNYFGVYGLKGDLYNVNGGKFDAVDEVHFIKTPLKQQVFRWFREKYDYVAYVRANESSYCWCIQYEKTVRGIYDQYDSYEEAENACIDKLIELAKQQDK